MGVGRYIFSIPYLNVYDQKVRNYLSPGMVFNHLIPEIH